MSTQLQQTGMSEAIVRIGGELGITRDRIQLIKDTVAKNTTDDELALFLYTAQRCGLDPLAKQIYCVKRWDGKLKREVATPQTSIDGYRLIADRTEKYAPGREPAYTYDAEGKLTSATAYVKKFVRGEWHEVAATAFWDEYVQTDKEGNVTSMWRRGRHFMLAKCAEALALRRAFPAELGGIYTNEEMGQADTPTEPRNITPLNGHTDTEKRDTLAQSLVKDGLVSKDGAVYKVKGSKRKNAAEYTISRDELGVRCTCGTQGCEHKEAVKLYVQLQGEPTVAEPDEKRLELLAKLRGHFTQKQYDDDGVTEYLKINYGIDGGLDAVSTEVLEELVESEEI